MSAVDAKNIIINVGVVDGASPAFHRIGNSAMTMGAKTNAGMGKAQSGMAAFGQTAGKVAIVGAAVIAVGVGPVFRRRLIERLARATLRELPAAQRDEVMEEIRQLAMHN